MENKYNEEVVQVLYSLNDPELFVIFMNYFSGSVGRIYKNMSDSLDALDDLADNPTEENKKKLRKIILDNFNDLPRETVDFFKKLTDKIIKEE